MDWHASSDVDDCEPQDDSLARAPAHAADIDVSLQNQSLTLLALMAAHPMPHRALQRFRDLLDAWRQDPSETSLVRALQAPPGRFSMNLDQVVQLLIPATPAKTPLTLDGARSPSCRRIERRSVRRPGQPAWPAAADSRPDIWRAVDSHQHTHDLFLMALLSTHTERRRVWGQFRALLDRLATSTRDSALDPISLVAVRRSAMRFDRILQIVTSVADAPPLVDAHTSVADADPSQRPRAAAARSTQRNVRAQSRNASVDHDG